MATGDSTLNGFGPKPCPTCGRCPTCGQAPTPSPYMPIYPHDYQPSPWWQIPPVTCFPPTTGSFYVTATGTSVGL